MAEALADPSTREAAIQEFRRALARTRTVIPSLEFAARVNKEIGQGSGDAGGEGRITIVFMANVDPGSWRPRAPRPYVADAYLAPKLARGALARGTV